MSQATASSLAGAVPEPIRRGRLGYALTDGWVLTKRHVIHTFRIPDLLIGSTISPIMFVLLFRYVFGGAIETSGTTYVNYLMAGIFIQTIVFGSMSTGIGLADDMHKGVVDRFRSLPMAPSAVLTGRTIADQLRNVITVLVMLLVGLLVGFRPEGTLGEFALALVLVLIFGYVMSWLAAIIGLVLKTPEATAQLGFVAIFPLTFASSAFVETASMPGWLQKFANNQPVSQVIDAVRALMLGQPVGNHVWVTLLWCAGLLSVFMPVAVAKYRRSVGG